jgi:hypothetical protein
MKLKNKTKIYKRSRAKITNQKNEGMAKYNFLSPYDTTCTIEV